MGLLNLLFSYFNLSSAISLISVIFSLIIIALINKPISKVYHKTVNQIDDIVDQVPNKSETTNKVIGFLKGSDRTLVYGPNNLMKYNAVLSAAIAL